MERCSSRKFWGRDIPSWAFRLLSIVWLSVSVLPCGFSTRAQSRQPPIAQPPSATETSAGQQLPDQQWTGSIKGTVVDRSGDDVVGALVTLTREDQSPNQEVLSGDDGQFSFANLVPGTFRITITARGFTMQTFSGVLHPGESYMVPPIALTLVTAITHLQVVAARTEVAEEEIKLQEKQRVLGILPNFYVSYVPDAFPLNSKQKFALAWKTIIDPVTLILTGAIAGVEQARNDFSGYGQGAQGYAKRFGASYADTVTGTFIGSAILPSLLKQDPRYFYKGTGSTRSRILYALANAVICKGDNQRWQPNYSNIFGSLAAAGISNLYYPKDRDGVGLTFENALIGMGTGAVVNLFQEFVFRKLTPKVPNYDPAQPAQSPHRSKDVP
jgi:Carboxypeptidase regulatory-like domain